ncbi:MAG TPA: hypothetical protein VH165_30795 [Kofleriaceae bacterium]|nr:hypothetical protein [Kofleriaceae bacterium]
MRAFTVAVLSVLGVAACATAPAGSPSAASPAVPASAAVPVIAAAPARGAPTTATSPAAPAAPAAPGAPTTAASPAAASPASAADPIAQLAQLGFAKLPDPTAPEAAKALAAARHALAAGKLDAARARLDDALGRSPGLAEARYLRATLDARTGALAAARGALDGLLAEDLYQFAPRIDADPTLAALRAAPEGAELRRRIAALTALWEVAIARGVPAELFDGAPGSQAILNARVLRPGVWVDAAHRLFAVTPPIADLRAAWVDVARHQTVTAALEVDDCRSDFCPRVRRTTVAVWPLAPAAQPSARWSEAAGDDHLAHGVTVQSVDGGARFQVTDCFYAGCVSPWLRLDARGARVDRERGRLDAPTLIVDHRGGTLALPAAALTIDGATLRADGGPAIEIGKRHRLTPDHCVARDGDQALVTTTFDRCECAQRFEGPVLAHEISRVDLATGRVESLGVGKGVVAAVRGPDGTMFVQVGGKVERFASIAEVGSTSGAALPDGVVIMAPVGPRSNCCGL